MLKYLLAFVSSLVLVIVITPLVRILALKVGAVDKPSGRKVHKKPIPNLGGVAIFVSFYVVLLVVCLLDKQVMVKYYNGLLGIFLGSLVIFFLGIYDDLKGAGAKLKFSFQILAAVVLILFGLVIDKVSIPFGGTLQLGWWGIPVTIFWVVAITNTLNLIDGLDGLAAGITSIVCVTLFLSTLHLQKQETAFVAVILAGAAVGFLKYNFNPAVIFMGDTGSMFLGFILAAAAILGNQKSTTMAALAIPVIAMGLPILDTLLAIIRRLGNGAHVFRADDRHIHHRLLGTGLSQRRTVLVLYFISICFGIVAFTITAVRDEYVGTILIIVGLLVFIAVRKLGLIEFRHIEKKNEVD